MTAVAYKVLTSAEMASFHAKGVFAGSPADLADGFIHLSTAEQLAGTLEKHYAGQTDLFLVKVDIETFGPALRWEASRGGQLFPHIYASLPMSAVLALGDLHFAPDGSIDLSI
jgi:uncharacterized protein (DUF952 family)